MRLPQLIEVFIIRGELKATPNIKLGAKGWVELAEKKILAYMATWTTYGSWLQGDKRGYVKNGQILPANENLKKFNAKIQQFESIQLNLQQQEIIKKAIMKKSKLKNQDIYAIAVKSNHVHIVVENNFEPLGKIVSNYKNAAIIALREYGFRKKLWTKGFDKRYCFDKNDLQNRIRYVNEHNKS